MSQFNLCVSFISNNVLLCQVSTILDPDMNSILFKMFEEKSY